MKIGVYGGSFNPCHLMHKQIVEVLLERNVFDRIIILPTGNFYKKSNLLKGEERKRMLELMFENHPRVIISDYEFKNNLICTYRSLDYLQNLYKGDKLYFILGSDNLLHFDTWKRYEYILNTYNLLVIHRKHVDVQDVIKKYQGYRGDIEWMDLDLSDIQSSKIREAILSGNLELAKTWLDEKVFSYILERGLYSKSYQERPVQQYISDEEFLNHYNMDDYEKMSVTTDITLFSVSDVEKESYRRKNAKSFSILLVKRDTAPFMNKWCIPGGFLSLDEKLLDCAKRVLFTEANIDHVYLNQLHTFSDIERDIRGRVLSVAYLGLIDKTKIEAALKPKASFFDLDLREFDDILEIHFHNERDSFTCSVRKKIDDYGIVSYEELGNGIFAFDHLKVIATSLEYLKKHIGEQDIIYHLLPSAFTLKELQLVYEAILGKKLIDSVFRRTVQNQVIPTDTFKKDGGHRPSRLYKYKFMKEELQ